MAIFLCSICNVNPVETDGADEAVCLSCATADPQVVVPDGDMPPTPSLPLPPPAAESPASAPVPTPAAATPTTPAKRKSRYHYKTRAERGIRTSIIKPAVAAGKTNNDIVNAVLEKCPHEDVRHVRMIIYTERLRMKKAAQEQPAQTT